MKPLILSDAEVRAIKAGARQLRIPMVPQPRPGLTGTGSPISPGYMVWDSKSSTIPMTDTAMYRVLNSAPYAPGDLVPAKEAWAK